MASKIVLISDNHGDLTPVNRILQDNPVADYYFHCGDVCSEINLIKPFIAVKGNNDWDPNLKKELIFEIEGHRILMFHGHNYTYNLSSFISKVKSLKCDVAFFGHTHEFMDEEAYGIRLINPGSCYYNRDFSTPCYAIVDIDNNGKISVKKVELSIK